MAWRFRAGIVAASALSIGLGACGPDNAVNEAGTAHPVANRSSVSGTAPGTVPTPVSGDAKSAFEPAIRAPEPGHWGPPAGPEAPWYAVQACVNMGNALDAPEEGAWGWSIETAHFQAIAAAGFDTVRIPIRWSAHTGEAPAFSIDPDFLARVDTVIREARDAGLNVIINVHHFMELMADPQAHRARLMAIWGQLAHYYRHLPKDVYFEILNEPHDQLQGAAMRDILREAVGIVRTLHPDRAIILGGDQYSKIATLDSLPDLDDPRIVPTFHYYDPFEFTHQDAPWLGEGGPRGPVSWGSRDDRTALTRNAKTAGKYRLDEDVPLLMGEFGVYNGVSKAERVAWTRDVRREFEAWGIGWCAWSFTTTFPLWDYETKTWLPGMLDALGLDEAPVPAAAPETGADPQVMSLE